MHLFVSAGEPSGDLHGANLIRSVREREPGLTVTGFGGERMAGAGADLVYPLTDLALVGLGPVVAALPKFWKVYQLAREHFRRNRPDVVVVIDFPGFHWWVAGAARRLGIPVIYFVPPQLWAWGGWRAGKMRRVADEVLCTLPFEPAWYAARNIPARFIGHPYFDELRGQRLDPTFVSFQRARPGTIVGILPGSRGQELQNNTASLLRAADLIHRQRPDVRFLVACLKEQQAAQVRGALSGSALPVEVHHGRTPEIIHLAHSCLSVSGSVGLELLYRGTPSVVTYRISRTMVVLGRLLKRCKYISLVNLLADRQLFPEYFGHRCMAEPMAEHILHWLRDRTAYETVCGELSALEARVAVPGACERAADAVLERLRGRAARAA